MSTSSTLSIQDPAQDTPPAVARLIARHLLCFSMPLITLTFVVTGPHAWYWALLWLLPGFGLNWLDNHGPPERRAPSPALPGWPFDAILYALTALQFVNVFLLVRMISAAGFGSLDFWLAPMIVASSSGFSGIVVAHELIHRHERIHKLMGRALLCTVLYEHFFTEHLRGHHARVGTDEDPATARFDEPFSHFLKRTVPAQFRSAWRLETRRLGDVEMRLLDPRQRGNRVLHGLLAEWGLAAGIGLAFGPAVFVVFVAQAAGAAALLEAVNYFEHWGLERQGRRVTASDSWDTDSWFTYYSLVGLSRHADHHAHASRPYPQLRVSDESPRLPTGYIGMVDMVIGRNRRARRLMREELERRKLGPFREDAAAAPQLAAT